MDSSPVRVAFWAAAIATPQHLGFELGEEASVSPEAMQQRRIFEKYSESSDEVEERLEKRQRLSSERKDEDEEEKEYEDLL